MEGAQSARQIGDQMKDVTDQYRARSNDANPPPESDRFSEAAGVVSGVCTEIRTYRFLQELRLVMVNVIVSTVVSSESLTTRSSYRRVPPASHGGATLFLYTASFGLRLDTSAISALSLVSS